MRALVFYRLCCLSHAPSVGGRWGRRWRWRHLDRLALRWLESIKRTAYSCSHLPCEHSQILRVPLQEVHGCLVVLLLLPRDVRLCISEVLSHVHNDWLSHRSLGKSSQLMGD